MTRFKKFAALVLAMMMALSLMVTPALAAGEVVRRPPALRCGRCGAAMDLELKKDQYRFVCPECKVELPWEDIDW